MSLVYYSDLILLGGQSNMRPMLQGLIDAYAPPDVLVVGESHEGAAIANNTWLSSAEPWARSSHYTTTLARAKGSKFKRVVSVWLQGETDAETAPLSLAYQAKLAQLHTFFAEDLLATDGVLYEVILLPWNTSTGTGTPYTNLRAGMLAYVAESPTTRVAIDTKDWERSGVDFVHLTVAAIVANTPTIAAAVNAFLSRAAASEGVTGGGGSGDMLASNNLSELTDVAEARTNLELTSAATSSTSSGGNSAADSGKLALFRADGSLRSSTSLQVFKNGSTTVFVTIGADNLTAAQDLYFPDAGGTLATEEYVGDNFQTKDADLTALAALSGTNTMYYRSGPGTWSAVTMGSGMSFSGGTLSSTGGSGGSTGNLVLSSATPDAEGLLTITALGATFKITPLSLTTGAETGSAIVLTSATPDAEGLLTLEALGISFKITPLSLT